MALIDWREHRLPLGLFFILGALHAVFTPMGVREAVALTRSEIPLGDLVLTPYSPAYLAILHFWSAVSHSAFWLRLLSLGLGMVGMLFVPRVLRGLGGAHAVPGAVWILALSPFLTDQIARVSPSALAFVAVIAALLCFLEFLRAGQLSWLGGWVAASLVSLLVHGGLYYLVLALCGGMLIYRGRYRGRQWAWWLAQLLPLGLFLWLSGTQFERFVLQRASQIRSVRSAADQWGDLGSGLPMPWPLIAGLLFALLVLSGLSICRDGRRDPRHGLLALGAIAPTLIWLVWLPHDFYAVAALPFLAVLVSMGIRLYPRWARQLLWAAVLVTYGWAHWYRLF